MTAPVQACEISDRSETDGSIGEPLCTVYALAEGMSVYAATGPLATAALGYANMFPGVSPDGIALRLHGAVTKQTEEHIPADATYRTPRRKAKETERPAEDATDAPGEDDVQ
jgi:hypothetical protein